MRKSIVKKRISATLIQQYPLKNEAKYGRDGTFSDILYFTVEELDEADASRIKVLGVHALDDGFKKFFWKHFHVVDVSGDDRFRSFYF